MNRSITALIATAIALTPIGATAQTPRTGNAQQALLWLECRQQQASGQIGPNTGNPIARSAEVVIGLAAAGQDAASFTHGTVSLADYLKTAATADVGTTGELLLARALEPSTGLTAPLVAQLATARSSSGEYGADVFSDALALLGLAAAKQAIADDAIGFLRKQQSTTDHGWSFENRTASSVSDSNTTALVVQALLAARVPATDEVIGKGLDYLKSQFENGGFVYSTGFGVTQPDPQSDELGIQAIVAANKQADTDWAATLEATEQDLAGRQLTSGPDAGALNAQFDKLMATTPATAAFLMFPLTSAAPSEARVALLTCPATPASASPTPHPQPPPALARTGSGPFPSTLFVVGLSLICLGVAAWRRKSAA